MDIKAIDKKFSELTQAQAELKAEDEHAFKIARQLRQQAEAAAAAGDVDKYRELKAQLENAEDDSFVRRAALRKKAEPISETMVREAWTDYAAGAEKVIAKRLAQYQKSLSAAREAYRAAIDIQREACQIRERLAGYIGVDVSVLSRELDAKFSFNNGIPNVAGPEDVTLRCGGLGVLDPDLAIYVSSLAQTPLELVQSSAAQDALRVVRAKRA